MRFSQRIFMIVPVLVCSVLFAGVNAKTATAADVSLYEIISENAADYLNRLTTEGNVSQQAVRDFIDAVDAALSGQTFRDESELKDAAAGVILGLAGIHSSVINAIIKTFGSEIGKIASGDYSGFEPLYNAIKQKYLGAGTAPGGSGAGGAPPVKKPEQPATPLAPEKVAEQLAQGKLTPEEAAAALAADLDSLSQDRLPADYQKNLLSALAGIFAAAGKIDPGQPDLTGDGQSAVLSVPEGALKSQLVKMKALRATLTESLNKAGFAALTGGLPWQITLAAPPAANRPQITVRLPVREMGEIGTAGLSLRLDTPAASITIPPGALPAGAGSTGQAGAALELKIEAAGETAAGKLMVNLPTGEANRLAPVGKPLVIGFSLPEADQGKAVSFSAPLRVSFPYGKGAVLDPELLGVYIFNADQNKWEYTGGEADPDQNMIAVKTAHPGIYTIMEYRGDFRDLAGHWARRDVRLMAARRLVSGTGPETFSPDAAITRAEFTVILARMLGLAPDPAGAARFADVPADAWYRGMVGAAVDAGLAAGVGPGVFAPAEPVTREQMAVMIARLLAKQKGTAIAENEAGDILAAFPDSASVSFWARAGVALLSKEKIMKGRESQRFVPGGWATRAEATVVLSRVLKNILADQKYTLTKEGI